MLIPLGVWLFIFAPVSVWREEREKVLKYEKVDLELVVDNSGQCIHRTDKNWIFRVGIKTNGRKSINNVELIVEKRNGEGHAYSDAPLRPAYSLPDDSSSFTIKPDEVRFVEVCSFDEGSPEMRMHYHANYQIILKYYDKKYLKDNPYGVPPPMASFLLNGGIPIGETITLCVTGDNAQSATKTIRIDTSGEQPKWEVVKLS